MSTAFADGETFGHDLAIMVKAAIVAAVAPITEANEALRLRIAALEEAAKNVPEIDLVGVEKMIEVEIAKLPTPESPKEIDMEEVAALIGAAVAALPPAEDGTSVTVEDILPLIVEEVAKATDPRDINQMVATEVAKAVASMPVPQDGKDAAGIVEALKDDGELVLTLQDGRLIRTGIRDGRDGHPGLNGFGFDDMDACVLDDDRTIELSFRRGEEEKVFTFKWPTMIYRDVFKDGAEYQQGDVVTWAGSLWHCNEATTAKPGTVSWTLAAKKGRDGKDFAPKNG